MYKTRQVNIPIYKNADFQVMMLIPIKKAFSTLAGYSFEGSIKSSTDPNAPIIAAFQFSPLDQTTSPGFVLWSLSNEITAAIPASISNSLRENFLGTPYLYDVFMIDNLGIKSKILQGRADVIPDVTAL